MMWRVPAAIAAAFEAVVNRRIRCHPLPSVGEWFHATEPSLRELNEVGGKQSLPLLVGMVDKHMLETSFDWEGNAWDIPAHLFPLITAAMVEAGRPVASDGSCHEIDTEG